jgi:uncharacterized protein YbcI
MGHSQPLDGLLVKANLGYAGWHCSAGSPHFLCLSCGFATEEVREGNMPEIRHEGPHSRRGETAAQISTGCVQLLSEYTGRGPTKAHTILNRDSVTIILQETLTKGERSLVAADEEDHVLRSRYAYQQVMREDLTALVERAVDRKVIAFLSANHLDPDVAVEFFLLEPGDGEPGWDRIEAFGLTEKQ